VSELKLRLDAQEKSNEKGSERATQLSGELSDVRRSLEDARAAGVTKAEAAAKAEAQLAVLAAAKQALEDRLVAAGDAATAAAADSAALRAQVLTLQSDVSHDAVRMTDDCWSARTVVSVLYCRAMRMSWTRRMLTVVLAGAAAVVLPSLPPSPALLCLQLKESQECVHRLESSVDSSVRSATETEQQMRQQRSFLVAVAVAVAAAAACGHRVTVVHRVVIGRGARRRESEREREGDGEGDGEGGVTHGRPSRRYIHPLVVSCSLPPYCACRGAWSCVPLTTPTPCTL
jgi:hypothetical protein